jgi:hypothetical protein
MSGAGVPQLKNDQSNDFCRTGKVVVAFFADQTNNFTHFGKRQCF